MLRSSVRSRRDREWKRRAVGIRWAAARQATTTRVVTTYSRELGARWTVVPPRCRRWVEQPLAPPFPPGVAAYGRRDRHRPRGRHHRIERPTAAASAPRTAWRAAGSRASTCGAARRDE